MTDKKLPENLVAAYKIIVDHLRANTTNQALLANFDGTEDRCAKALIETCTSDEVITNKLQDIIKTTFPVEHTEKNAGGMITQGPISIDSHCPHHLYPVRYVAYVSYLPQEGQVLGLSKLARISKVLGRRPVLHEQLASDIADVLYKDEENPANFPSISSGGSAVMLVGLHSCMSCRGINEDALTSVVELRGRYWEAGFEEKFYNAVESIKTAKPY
jgi:GTP cyclohydrolase I